MRRPEAPAPGGVLTSRDTPRFDVQQDAFTGPFDVLLGLIGRKLLDVTEVALAEVTDDFVAHARRLSARPAAGEHPDGHPADHPADHLGQVSAFCVVAATLLELKAARLLPGRDEDDVEDVELLEARDLLFARLLQHRAYARAGAELGRALASAARAVPRAGFLDDDAATALPPLVLDLAPADLARLAAAALVAEPRRPPAVATGHLHAPAVSVPAQVELLTQRLHGRGEVTFAALVADASDTAVVVGRFLALLELHRRALVDLAQEEPLAPLRVRWVREVAA